MTLQNPSRRASLLSRKDRDPSGRDGEPAEAAYYVADAALHDPLHEAEGALIDIAGEPFYCVTHYDAMAPFLMSLVSDSDLWMFVSSTGALTAGRRDADNALFPYYTDDHIHDSQDQTGAKTILRVLCRGRTQLWEPFSERYKGLYRITRRLSKSAYGNKLIFEEVNHDLELSFSSAWLISERFGFVRRAALQNLAIGPVEVVLLDGLQNLMPSGLTRRFQMEYSTLADGYKESELHRASGLGLFRLSAIPADQPKPREALRATTVWSEGIEASRRLLCTAQIDRFRRGLQIAEEALIRGRRGAYFVQTALTLAAQERKEWSLIAEVAQDAAAVAALLNRLKFPDALRTEIDANIADGTGNLARLIAGADGLQMTGDRLNVWRHFSNALFNSMRGGIPDDDYTVSKADFMAFLSQANRRVHSEQAEALRALPEKLRHDLLVTWARNQQDPDLERLAYEYLPLTFSRRHGDPSRPWNIFSIEVKGEHGEKILNYQGNWRDIFQNWEALAHSYPGFVESMIFKFVDASTADGYNPYRITRNGFDWEVLDAHDAWSYIGYWGDHQVIYLLKLLEISSRYHPGALNGLLTRRVFTYADVPYRIKPYQDTLADPHNTIEFDAALDRRIKQRAAEMGTDGKSLLGADGTPCRANLTEKLLVLILARFFNYIPAAGLWMNTQRPEWNDANNALVGNGVSMVTLCYLRRFLSFARDLFATSELEAVEVLVPVEAAFRSVAATLEEYSHLLDGEISDRTRKLVLDRLGAAGSAYRAQLYGSELSDAQTSLAIDRVVAFCDVGLRHIDHSIRANRRADGLYHAYNLMRQEGDGIAISPLQEMLEGQVAVLSSGTLSVRESAELLDALRASKLYRADQNSYILYPDKILPGFLQKNNIPADALADCKTLTDMIARGDRRIVSEDVNGVAHFNAAFCNASMLEDALLSLGLPADEQRRILALYEKVFNHRAFTGRSGAFYKYEGLGCIYWHMVSKLLLEVQDVIRRAAAMPDSRADLERLQRQYREIRDGIGSHKSPAAYGAIPLDPYSHTPGFAGVQQPGMTGQVKEDIISRFGELGAVVQAGRLGFSAPMVNHSEFLREPVRFQYVGIGGRDSHIDLDPGTAAFTLCQVPVVLHAGGIAGIEVSYADGVRKTVDGLVLDVAVSAAIFERRDVVRRLDVFLGRRA
ncbi:MAG TPA: hypothetical protein VGC27_04255 [Rhizomicrobium sp.]